MSTPDNLQKVSERFCKKKEEETENTVVFLTVRVCVCACISCDHEQGHIIHLLRKYHKGPCLSMNLLHFCLYTGCVYILA